MSKTKRVFKVIGLVIVFTTISLTAVQWFSILFQAPPIHYAMWWGLCVFFTYVWSFIVVNGLWEEL